MWRRVTGAPRPTEMFREARRLTTWHYQWMILHEFLPLFIGQSLVNNILRNGRKFYRPREAFMPVEFQGAAYRFGHTMVRPSYRANLAGDNGKPFFGMIFDPAGEGQADPVDLRGGARAPRRFIGWQTFFDFGKQFTDGPGELPLHSGNPAEQADRHAHLHPAVPSATRRDRVGRPTDLSAAAESAPSHHLVTPVWPETSPRQSALTGPVQDRI